jgi:hypothetical protein
MRLPSRPASCPCTVTQTSLPVFGCTNSRWLALPVRRSAKPAASNFRMTSFHVNGHRKVHDNRPARTAARQAFSRPPFVPPKKAALAKPQAETLDALRTHASPSWLRRRFAPEIYDSTRPVTPRASWARMEGPHSTGVPLNAIAERESVIAVVSQERSRVAGRGAIWSAARYRRRPAAPEPWCGEPPVRQRDCAGGCPTPWLAAVVCL